MGGLGLFKQGWKWIQSQKQAFVSVRVAVICVGEKLVLVIDRHWPLVYSWCMVAGRLLFRFMLQWKDCVVGGLRSMFTLGSAALFVILWSCFLGLTSTTSLVCVLLSLVCSRSWYDFLQLQGLLFVGIVFHRFCLEELVRWYVLGFWIWSHQVSLSLSFSQRTSYNE